MSAPKPIPGFTWNASARGWYRSFQNKPVYCGGLKATRREIEQTYAEKCRKIETGERQSHPVSGISLRDATTDYIAALRHRRDTGKPRRLAPRTFHNNVQAVNAFGAFIGGDRALNDISPADFAAYAKKYGAWKSSGFDSVVCRVGAFFRWCEEMELLVKKYAPGPAFRRPQKHEITNERVERQRRFSAAEIAKLYDHANATLKCWIGLGICCAFNNSDVANVTREAIDLKEKVVDFRRRKTGRVRRVCPLPDDVVADLKAYTRPEPVAEQEADLFFVSEYGHAYSRTSKGDGKPSDSISRMLARLIRDSGVAVIKGRNFAGLRTSFANLAPPGYRDEVELIMGHAHGTILKDHYLESVDLDRLRFVVEHVWGQVLAHRAAAKDQVAPGGG